MSREIEKTEHAGMRVGDRVRPKGGKGVGTLRRIYRYTPTALFRFVVEWDLPSTGWLLPITLYASDIEPTKDRR